MKLTTWIILFERATRLIERIIFGAVESTTARRHDGTTTRRHDGSSNICMRKMEMNRIVRCPLMGSTPRKVHMRIDHIAAAQLQFAHGFLWKCAGWRKPNTRIQCATFRYIAWFCILNYEWSFRGGLAFALTTNENWTKKKKMEEKPHGVSIISTHWTHTNNAKCKLRNHFPSILFHYSVFDAFTMRLLFISRDFIRWSPRYSRTQMSWFSFRQRAPHLGSS